MPPQYTGRIPNLLLKSYIGSIFLNHLIFSPHFLIYINHSIPL